MTLQKTLSVSAIQQGTVIDHIPAGQALKILRLLNFAAVQVTIGLNLKSGSMTFKDLIKIENVFLSESQAAQIAIFAPTATVNVIQNYKVAKKFRVQMPEAIEAALVCPNPRCITQFEPISTLFFVEENNEKVSLRCRHCEKLFEQNELQK